MDSRTAFTDNKANNPTRCSTLTNSGKINFFIGQSPVRRKIKVERAEPAGLGRVISEGETCPAG